MKSLSVLRNGIFTVLVVLMSILAQDTLAQAKVEPTSATDPEVKIHKTKRSAFYSPRKREARKKHEPGRALPKQKKGSVKTSEEAKVFSRQGRAGKKESARAKRRGSKKKN